jgi:hypothetical protein
MRRALRYALAGFYLVALMAFAGGFAGAVMAVGYYMVGRQ